jgi:uncharacterized protein YyaL (SSP411 family)
VLCEALARLAVHLGDEGMRRLVGRTLAASRPLLARAPSAFASLLCAADLFEGPVLEIAIAGDPGGPEAAPLLRVVRGCYLPRRALACGPPTPELPLLAGRHPVQGRPAAYVCRNQACEAPTTDPEALARLLD